MVFGVIIFVDSYLYTAAKFCTPLYMGVGGGQFMIWKNATQFNRDPKII
jgi:hypothetical protein